MPKVDTAYIVGVIREKEKGLLQDDEYTRIIQSPRGEDAVRALIDTPYGIHIEQAGNVFDAITATLESEMNWLKELIQDDAVLLFLTARYDGLQIARALTKYQAGEPRIGQVPSPSGISHDVLSSTIWDGEGFEDLPEVWREFVRQEREKTQEESWSRADLLTRVEEQIAKNMKMLARTPLMEAIARHTSEHILLDKSLRAKESTGLPSWMPAEAAKNVTEDSDATMYEKMWDEQLLRLIRDYRAEPTGYDPIVAYWYAKEVEARTVRLIISAKLGGISQERLEHLQRSRYLANI